MQTINTNHSHKLYNFLTGFLVVLCVSFYSNKANAQAATGAATSCGGVIGQTTGQFGAALGCTGAATINISGTLNVTGRNCAGGNAKTVNWFSFSTSGTAHTYFITATTVTANTQLQIKIWGACGGLLIGACVDNITAPGAQTEQVSLQSVASPSGSQLALSTTYYVEVINNGTAASMPITMCILSDATAGVSPCNPTTLSSTCTNNNIIAAELSNFVTTQSSPAIDPTTVSASFGGSVTPVGTYAREHWYIFPITGSYNQVISVSATAPATGNAVIEIFSGSASYTAGVCGTTLTPIAYANATNTISAINTETATTPSEPPGTYYIRIIDYVNTWAAIPALSRICVNTTCAAANALTLGTCRSGNGMFEVNTNPTLTSPPPACASVGGEQWYTYTPAVTGTNYTVTGSGFGGTQNDDDLIIQILSGTCGSLTTVGSCLDVFPSTANGPQTEQISFNGTVNVPVYIRVVSTTTDSLLSICINPTPLNDEPNCAYSLTANSATCTQTLGTLLGATYSLPACAAPTYSSNEDVWYSFTAGATGIENVLVTPNSAGMDPAFDVYTSSPGLTTCASNPTAASLTSLSTCVDSRGAGSSESYRLTGLVSGQIYWVRVYDNGTGVPADPNFAICITSPPPNDDCSGGILPAYTLSSAACTNGDVNGATNSSVTALCGSGTPSADVWFNITVPAFSSKTLTLTPSASLNAVIEYFPSFATLACSNASGSSTCINGTGAAGAGVVTSGSIVNNTSAAATYLVRVYHYAGGIPSTTTFQLCITDSPTNDHICASTVLTPTTAGGCNPQTGDINGADYGTPTIASPCGGAYNDVWYQFTPTGVNGQSYILNIAGSSGFNPSFEVFTATTANCATTGTATLTTLGSTTCTNVTGVGAAETLTFTIGGGTGAITVASGTTYYVRVFNSGGGTPTTTTFTVCLTKPPLNNITCTSFPANAEPTPITPGGACKTPTNIDGATSSSAASASCGTSVNDIWYSFTATSASTTITVTGLNGYNPIAELYQVSGSCPTLTLTSKGCTSVTTANGVSSFAYTGLGLTTYLIRVYDETGVVTAGSNFTICVTTITPPPPNNACAGYINIPVSRSPACNPINGTLLQATGETPVQPVSAGATCSSGTVPAAGPADVWYYFTAGATSETVTLNSLSNVFRPVFEVWQDGCGNVGPQATTGVSLGCTSAALNGTQATASIGGLTIGNNYFVRVYNYDGTVPTASPTFNICVKQDTTAVSAAANNIPCNAIPVQCNTSVSGYSSAGLANAPACSGITATGLWYVMLGPPSVTSISLSTANSGSNYDTQIDVFTGTCGSLSCLAQNNNAAGISTGPYTQLVNYTENAVTCYFLGFIPYQCGAYYTPTGTTTTTYLGSQVTFAATPGTYYYIFVSGPSSTSAAISNHWGPNGNAYQNYQTNTGVGINVSWFFGLGNGFAPLVPAGVSTVPNTAGHFQLDITATPCNPLIIPLPIELVTFEGKSQGKKNLLHWATASETNNDYFTVEKSADAMNFEPLAKVAGAGNSSSLLNYSTYDNNPINGTTYYRLKQTDYNGASTYSSIISVDNAWTDVNVSNVHPNPTNNNINFDFYTSLSGKVIVRIYDYMGRLVDEENQNVNEGNSSLQAKMENLSNGVYFLKVSFDKTGDIIVTKVVKN